MDVLESLESCRAVSTYEVLEYRTWSLGRYYKISATIIDGSCLFAREFVDVSSRNYAYHWQDHQGDLIVRWDNAPHHRQLGTYPHHCHASEGVQSSLPVDLADVLKVIERRLGEDAIF
jgi:hypothetical protein